MGFEAKKSRRWVEFSDGSRFECLQPKEGRSSCCLDAVNAPLSIGVGRRDQKTRPAGRDGFLPQSPLQHEPYALFSLCRVASCDIKATSHQKRLHVRELVPLRHAVAKVEGNLGRNLGRIRVVPQQNGDVMAVARHRACKRVSKMRLAALALVLASSPACADTFQEKWMGRIARPPADDQEASVYWEDKWDARGKRFKANEVSCAHRTEAFGHGALPQAGSR